VTGFLWAALGVLGGLGMTAIGDMVSEEVRDRLDHLPHAILRLGARLLDQEQRAAVYDDEWMPELTYILKGDEARPVTRLYHGIRYAFGILAAARRIAARLDYSSAGWHEARQLLVAELSELAALGDAVALITERLEDAEAILASDASFSESARTQMTEKVHEFRVKLDGLGRDNVLIMQRIQRGVEGLKIVQKPPSAEEVHRLQLALGELSRINARIRQRLRENPRRARQAPDRDLP
jgi:hypothetical protein